MGGFARTQRITRESTSSASHALILRVEKLCERLGISRAIRLLESTAIDVPLVIGAIRPVIVVPVSLITGLTPLQLDMLLVHELAHIRRHDYLINLVQTVFETLLFYHPAARWISDRAREERENCCDDVAVEMCGGDAGQYTTTLLVLEESRGQGFGLAAAATGGSLLRRAERLITGRNSYVELGPRWIAGVLTIAAALFTGNKAIAGIQSSFTVTPAAATKDSTKKHDRNFDNSRAAPSSVTRAPLSGGVSERFKWAERNGGSGSYWIGYLVAGDETGKSRFYTSEMPVRIDGDVTLTGRMSLGDGDLRGFVFYGVPLAPIVGAHSPNTTAVFLQVSHGVMGRRIDRVHLSTFSLPVYFDRKPVIWLDSANDGESLALLHSLMSDARDEETRRDLVAAIGVHRDRVAATPMLIDILQSRAGEGVRREAAQWLGHSRDASAMTALSGAARRDREKGVREEAIEAFGHMDTAPATDTLIAFASSFDSYDLKRTAIEALGHREDDKALSFLTRVVQTDSYDQARMDALEALADMSDGRGMNIVIDLARKDRDPEIRRKAVEMIADVEPASRAFDMLKQIIQTDPSEDVRAEAVETIAEVHDAASVRILTDIANHNSSERIQVEAVESLGETVDPQAALKVLKEIARDHPSAEARKKALEAIIDFKDETAAIDAIVQAVRNDRDEEVRKSALEALGDPDDRIALSTLESFVRGKESYEIRAQALEVYANSTHAPTALALLNSVITNDPSIDMRVRAVELLEEVEDKAGFATLRQVAKSSKDQRVRERAAEILNNQ
jgi:HEAT repeat protein